MAEPARKFTPEELPARGAQKPADNIIDFNQYRRNLDQARRPEQQIAEKNKAGAPMNVPRGMAGGGVGGEKPSMAAAPGAPAEKGPGAEKKAPEEKSERPTPGKEATLPERLPTSKPAEKPEEQGETPGQSEEEQKRELETEKGKDKKKKKGKEGEEDREEEGGEKKPARGKKVDTVGKVLFFLLLCSAVLIDLLTLFTAGFSAILDWTLDAGFFVAMSIVLLIVTGDLIGSLVGRRGITNMIQTVAEFIPAIDALPFHIAAVALIYIDLQYDPLSKIARVEKIAGMAKKIGGKFKKIGGREARG